MCCYTETKTRIMLRGLPQTYFFQKKNTHEKSYSCYLLKKRERERERATKIINFQCN